MKFLESDDLKEFLRFAPDPAGQTERGRFILTVLDVLQIVGEGTVGGSEEAAQEARRIKRPARKSSRESSGHWDLVQGVYWVTYNETPNLPDGHTLILQPHEGLLKNGLYHPTLFVRDWSEISGILLVVAGRGVRLMENAPITTGFVFR